MKVGEALSSARGRLAASVTSDAIEAEALVRHALGVDRAALYTSLNKHVDTAVSRDVASLVERRLRGEPLAYVTGRREFYSLEMGVNADVLVPRQETETLVESVIEFVESSGIGGRVMMADVGTGSGAIAVALANELPNATVVGTDLSQGALRVADANRQRHGVSDRVHLVRCDLLGGLGGALDVIVSNPPYIATGDMASLPADVRQEPALALDGGSDGLRVAERLIRQAVGRLAPSGGLFVEIAPEQARPVAEIAQRLMPGCRVSFADDLSKTPRVAVIRPGPR